MLNPQKIAENIVALEKQFYEINPSGNFLESISLFCHALAPIFPSYGSFLISDTEKFISSFNANLLNISIENGQTIESYWNIKQAITENEVLERSFRVADIPIQQLTVPLHDGNDKPIGSFTFIIHGDNPGRSLKLEELRKETLQAICSGMEMSVISRYLAEKLNQIFHADLILFTEYDESDEQFYSKFEFKFDKTNAVAENSDKEKITNGTFIFKSILNNARTYTSKLSEVTSIKNAPFKNDFKKAFIVTPLVADDRIIGTLNIAFNDTRLLDKQEIDLLDELAYYISICYIRERLLTDLSLSNKKTSELEISLQTLEKSRSLHETAVETSLKAYDFLNSFIQYLCGLFEKHEQSYPEIWSAMVDQLETMTIKNIRDRPTGHGISQITTVETGVLINEAIQAFEENLVKNNSFNKNIHFVNRINNSGICEISQPEFAIGFNSTLFSLLKRSPNGSRIFFSSSISDTHLTITIKNDENDLPAPNRPKRNIAEQENAAFDIRLNKMLFNLNRIGYHYEFFSDFHFKVDIVFQLAQQPVSLETDTHEMAVHAGGFRIMIVDDDDSLRELMVDILQSRNFNVNCFGDPTTAIDEFKKGKYNLLITDLSLPKISGLELATIIKELNPSIPVIMVTGWGNETDQIQANNAQIDFVLSKPFNLIDLLEVVENSLKPIKV